MYPDKLPNNEEYNYYHWQFFKNHLNITRSFVEKDFIRNMHEQEFYEINIIVKGSGMHYIKDNKISAKVGDVFVIPPNISHGYFGGKGFDVFHLLISDSFINKFTSDLQQLPAFHTLFSVEPLMRSNTERKLYLSLNNKQFATCNNLLNDLLKNGDFNNPYECLSATSTVLRLITFFCDIYNENFSKNKVFSKDENFMKTISYLHECYSEKITLESLSKMANTSRSSYINKFKEICKTSPLNYLANIRLSAAENLLLNTDFSIAEIAFKTGFYDSAHFTKVFIAKNKLSPLNYKKTFKEKHLKNNLL